MRFAWSRALLVALSLFSALAVALTGSILLWSYGRATLAAAAEREGLVLSGRAHALADELGSLIAEVDRLSRLADVDLADANLEPEKTVLRLARRDSGVFSASIVLLDARGEVLWAEPRDARPGLPGRELVALAASRTTPAVRYLPWEIDVVAPVNGQGAIAAVVDGRRGRDLFGPEVRHALLASSAVELVLRQDGRELVVARAPPAAAPPALRLDGPGQAWLVDPDGKRWLVTERAVGSPELFLRETLSAASLQGSLARPFRQLAAVVAALTLLAVGGGLGLALLARRLGQAELELARARELAGMGKTSVAVAHEVKNALNGLSVSLDLLASGAARPEVREAVHARARAEVGRLRKVADDLTLFAGVPRLAAAPLDAGRLLGEVAQSVSDLAQDARVELDVSVPPGQLPLRGDEARLVSALINLARNGIEAMGPGGFGEALGEPAPPRPRRLELSAARDGDGVTFTVADRGPGLPAEVRARLFEPFVTTKRSGTGLGLAITRRIVEAHGGDLTAADRPGGGMVFRVRLPPAPTEAA